MAETTHFTSLVWSLTWVSLSKFVSNATNAIIVKDMMANHRVRFPPTSLLLLQWWLQFGVVGVGMVIGSRMLKLFCLLSMCWSVNLLYVQMWMLYCSKQYVFFPNHPWCYILPFLPFRDCISEPSKIDEKWEPIISAWQMNGLSPVYLLTIAKVTVNVTT